MTDIDSKPVGSGLAEGSMDENVEVADKFAPLPEEAARRSKKRLREVSVEIPSPKDEKEVPAVELKEVDGPSKKNRLKTGENSGVEGDPPMPTTPPASAAVLSTSPPHDAKVRQIRRRVKDLSWKEGQSKPTDQLVAGDIDQPDDGPETVDIISEDRPEDDDSSKSVSAKSDSEKEEAGVSNSDVKSSTAPVPQTESTSGLDASILSDSKEAEVLYYATGSISGRLSPDPDSCQGKRRRDGEDQNPRDPKRITPPPDKDKDKPEPDKETPKPSGFLAYASTSSPFASANGPSIFGSATSKPTFGSPTVLTPTFSSVSPAGPSTSTKLTPSFGSAFSKYSGVASPFATTKHSGGSPFGVASGSKSSSSGSKSPTRSKSPGRHVNAFEPYTKSSGKFTAVRPPKKKQRRVSVTGSKDGYTGSGSASESADEEGEEEPGRPTSFGDILSAKDSDTGHINDDEKKIKLIEQEVVTGEEDEYTEFQVRSKLFELVSATSWEERGVGMLKLNINENTGRARLVLRTDGVLRLVLNTALFKGMDFSPGADPRYVKFGLVKDKKVVPYTLRFSTAKHAEDLLAHVRSHISELRSSSSPAPSSKV